MSAEISKPQRSFALQQGLIGIGPRLTSAGRMLNMDVDDVHIYSRGMQPASESEGVERIYLDINF
jgi:hypothetical protein